MKDAGQQEVLIVRRDRESEEEHHKGGVWKIAHADFMTAMMAFFLIMWLLNATNEETRASVANYFNPVKLAESTADKKGLRDPQNNGAVGLPRTRGQGEGGKADGTGKPVRAEEPSLVPQPKPPHYTEAVLFRDPYAVLAKLSAEAEPDTPHDVNPDVVTSDKGKPGLNGGEAYRDPFDPVYWQLAPQLGPPPKVGGSATGTGSPVPKDRALDATAPRPDIPPALPDAPAATGEQSHQAKAAAETKDVSASASDNKGTQAPPPAAAAASGQAEATALASDLGQAVQAAVGRTPGPHLEVRKTPEGVLISLTDDIDFAMFAVGSAEPAAKLVRAMAAIGKALAGRPGAIVIRGHTDARPYRSENYDNWRLSTARAHMAYYMLVRGGLDEKRVERIEGYADRRLKNPADPQAAENRRIEILIREGTS